jgi:hypothetical protein
LLRLYTKADYGLPHKRVEGAFNSFAPGGEIALPEGYLPLPLRDQFQYNTGLQYSCYPLPVLRLFHAHAAWRASAF